ncbi:MAG TPA: gluconate 2-dehydrogenase subunit 3 family protein [Bryobacteraceae bacterium]|nr:gluconate 2-dehydrogenase subunit 3 family protein [Bryobacteraceae bacterium]
MPDRRDALKIIGAIGTTCAFPFSADELYGQHDHGSAEAAKLPEKPSFFTAQEFETVKRLADLIIPPTDTPGAVDAGVPFYIDYVVNSSAAWKALFREGLQWLDRGKAPFADLTERQQIAMLKPLAAAADRMKPPVRVAPTQRAAAARRPREAPMEVRFFKAFKSMTADGYFTSKAGLVETLGYTGNTVLAEFPTCLHEH